MEKPNTFGMRSWARSHYGSSTYNDSYGRVVDLCEFIDALPDEKVTVAEIREFVEQRRGVVPIAHKELLDFIDNGPRKPTPYEVLYEVNKRLSASLAPGVSAPSMDARCQLQALQDAGYLTDEVG